MSNSVADFQVLLLRMPVIHHWINMEQLWTLWKLSNSSVNSLSQNIQDKKSRLENLTWRLWYRQQKAIAAATCSAPAKLIDYPTNNNNNNKFYMDVEELTEDEEEEDDDDDESDSWDMEQDLLFEKREDNNVYHISSQQPVSLLTQMLQQQNNNNKQKPQQQQSQQTQPILRRCQSKYHSLDEWFATSS